MMKYFDCVARKNIYITPAINGVEDAAPPKDEEITETSQRINDAVPVLVGAALNADEMSYYDFQKTMTEYRCACVVVTESGIVLNIKEDKSVISPGVGQTVFGIDEYPEEMTFDRTWRYDFETETFSQDIAAVQRNALVANTAKRDHLQNKAIEEAYPLQLRVSTGTATDRQKSRLNAINAYIIALDDMTPEQLQQSPLAFPMLAGVVSVSTAVGGLEILPHGTESH